MAEADMEQRIGAVRRFNRFYTQRVGILSDSHMGSPFSLTEVRVLYELTHREGPTATDLGRDLGLDAGYLSRILRRFQQEGLIERTPSRADRRQSQLTLTERGRAAYGPLEERTRRHIGAMLRGLDARDQGRMIEAMGTIERLFGAPPPSQPPVLLRSHRPGDMGWVVYRHGVLYAQERGWDERFEAVVARVTADFIQSFDPQRERCWIAERDGERVGSVFLVAKSRTVAKLRLLLVEPAARGIGLGRRLVEECVGFAREAGYRKITLWTNQELDAARHIYKSVGFVMVHRAADPSLGPNWIGETWDLQLT